MGMGDDDFFQTESPSAASDVSIASTPSGVNWPQSAKLAQAPQRATHAEPIEKGLVFQLESVCSLNLTGLVQVAIPGNDI